LYDDEQAVMRDADWRRFLKALTHSPIHSRRFLTAANDSLWWFPQGLKPFLEHQLLPTAETRMVQADDTRPLPLLNVLWSSTEPVRLTERQSSKNSCLQCKGLIE
jgi:hypothetical protein